MKRDKKHSSLESIKKEQMEQRVLTLEFKAEVVRHKKAENLSFADCGRKFMGEFNGSSQHHLF